MSVIKTENLTYTYSPGTPFEKTAVNKVSLEIEKGGVLGIMGHTGSGKSTLIQHFNALLKPTSGKIYIDGIDIWSKQNKKKIRDVRFKVGLVFQYPEYQLFAETVFKDISFGPKNMGLSEKEITERVYESASAIGLPLNLMDRSPFELSGGQKRRAAIAGIMAMHPQVLILDEPTAGLDPRGRDMILEQINIYHKKTGNTVLIVSHSMEDLAKTADKIIVMNKAEILCYDETAKVFGRADEIEKTGLDVPQITRIINGLRIRGIDLGNEVFTVKHAKDLIMKRIGIM